MLRFAAVSLVTVFAITAAPAFAQSVPPGTYRQSCNNIRVRGQQVIASCSAPNGGRIESSTSVNCPGDIGNVNGSLRCNRGAAPAPVLSVPPGTYRQSCNNIRVRGQEVIASCSASNGGRIESSTSVNCPGDIGNVNGSLRCNSHRRFHPH